MAWTWLLPDQLEDFSKSLLYALFFASNLYFARDTGYFAAAAEEKPLLHTWSLAIEEQYYLFFPLLLAALSRLGRRGCGLGLAIVGVASLALAQRWSAAQPEQTFFATPARIWELMLGSGLAVGLPPAWTLGRRTREAGAALGLAAILFAVLRFDARTPSPSAWMLVPALGTAGVLVFASPQTGVGRLLGSAPFVALGLVSYSAYLWHQPLLAFARARSATALSDLEKLALLGAALGLAALSWRALEQPFRDRRRVGRRRLARAVSVGAASLFAAALAGDLSDGFEARYAERWAAVRSDLDARRAERDALIRAGECHFNGRGAHGEIDAFLDGWSRESCGFDARLPSLEKLPYVVVGDSHAADVVMALKANGHVPLEMSGAGCSLVPSRMSASCRRQFEQLRRALAEDREYAPGAREPLHTR